MVFDMRNVDGCKRSRQRPSPTQGKLAGYWACKCAKGDAFTHSYMGAKVPTLGLAPEALSHSAQNITILTKYEESKPEISNSRRSPPFSPRKLYSRIAPVYIIEIARFRGFCNPPLIGDFRDLGKLPHFGDFGDCGDFCNLLNLRNHRNRNLLFE